MTGTLVVVHTQGGLNEWHSSSTTDRVQNKHHIHDTIHIGHQNDRHIAGTIQKEKHGKLVVLYKERPQ